MTDYPMTETAEHAVLPALSRRREMGGGSARSLLMTVLGEYVRPAAEPVWTASLVQVLALLGVAEKSARQALARTAAEGWLAPQRHGRQVRWNLTGPGERLLSAGAQRIYAFGRDDRPWAGQWLLLLASVPETRRELRHRLRTRLSWAGFGSPSPGVWACPDTGRETEARTILAELGLAGQSMSFLASYGSIGDQRSVARLAWDLDTLAARYAAFTVAVARRAPATGAELLVATTMLVHEWRRFPFLDPRLPAELLPEPWSGTAAARLFRDRHAAWAPGARQHWHELAAAPATTAATTGVTR